RVQGGHRGRAARRGVAAAREAACAAGHPGSLPRGAGVARPCRDGRGQPCRQADARVAVTTQPKTTNNMRKKLVAGNWKMHGSHTANAELLQGILAARPFMCDVAVCVPFPYLS